LATIIIIRKRIETYNKKGKIRFKKNYTESSKLLIGLNTTSNSISSIVYFYLYSNKNNIEV